jgi:hypothetical protein
MARSAQERKLANAECARQSRKRKHDELTRLQGEVDQYKRRLLAVEHENVMLRQTVQAQEARTYTQALAMASQPFEAISDLVDVSKRELVTIGRTSEPELNLYPMNTPCPLDGVSVADIVAVSGSTDSSLTPSPTIGASCGTDQLDPSDLRLPAPNAALVSAIESFVPDTVAPSALSAAPVASATAPSTVSTSALCFEPAAAEQDELEELLQLDMFDWGDRIRLPAGLHV